MDSIAFRTVVEAESGRFLETLASVDLDAAVPSCPGWQLADLLWHLAEVHGFWAEIVNRLLEDPAAADELERPPDPALQGFAAERRAALLAALARRSPMERCWSWSEIGGDVSSPADAEVSGDAWDLDRWLWGRGDAAALVTTGALEVVTRFRALVAEATQ